jgi:putative hydrolase of the HAD superfamily
MNVAIPRPPCLVAFDADYTVLRPGPQFEARGYRELGHTFGLDLDESRWPQAERAAFLAVKERRELHRDGHDDGLMQAVALAVIRAMGGRGEARIRACAEAQIERWHRIESFSLYEDVLPCLRLLAAAGVRGALISNTARDLREAVAHFGLSSFIGTAVASSEVGAMKPDPRIFTVALARAGVAPEDAVMVGDNYYDDVLGARNAGMSAILLDRGGRSGKDVPTIRSLAELPAAVGASRSP